MTILLEKHWPTISILLILALLVCLLFWPGVARPLGLTVLLLSLVAGLTFATQKHVRAWRQGRLERAGLVRNLSVELSGILLIFAAVWLIVGRVARSAGLLAANAAELRWPGAGAGLGLLAGLLTGLLLGIGIGLLVQSTWGRLVKRPRARVTQA
jgi:hypothetical protein